MCSSSTTESTLQLTKPCAAKYYHTEQSTGSLVQSTTALTKLPTLLVELTCADNNVYLNNTHLMVEVPTRLILKWVNFHAKLK